MGPKVYFRTRIWKNYCHIWNQHPRISVIAKFSKETKLPNLGSKMPYLSIFDQKCVAWVFFTKNALFRIFGLEFWKNYCHICIKHLWICLIANFWEETKMPKFAPKNALFGNLWARNLKGYCQTWNQHPRISVTAKFYKESKLPKFGTRSALFGYFWSKMPYLATFGPQF